MVHLVRGDNLVLDSFIVQVDGILWVLAVADEQVLHSELVFLVPSNLEAFGLFVSYGSKVQQVINLFIVNL